MTIQYVEEVPLDSIQPRNVRLYLRTHGWERPPDSHLSPDVWELISGNDIFEVIAPSSRQVRDFARTMAELLRTVSIAEDRSPIEVVRDLSTLTFDVQYIHCEYEGPSGTAPLRDTVELYKAAYGILSASSASLEDPRLVLPPRRPPQTAELMRRVLAGPTASGSYVASLWVPVPPRLSPEEDSVLFDMELNPPFARAATQYLYKALNATGAAVQQVLTTDDGVEAFTSRTAEGISANLCESLVHLSGEDETPFDFKFSWALDRPVASANEVVGFTPTSIGVLKQAAQEIRALLPEDAITFRGNVVRLHREGSNLAAGEASIAGVIVGDPDEKLRRVTVSLTEADYQEAITAHKLFEEVEMTGPLVRRGNNRTYMTNPQAFTRHVELTPP